jgi:FKBP-type peptidyl-prolyl cis-trans isomerase FklB
MLLEEAKFKLEDDKARHVMYMEIRKEDFREEQLRQEEEKNAKKEGVKTTASGLQYKVLKSGAGKSPKPADKVKVHYHGTLIDGSVFDSSVERGEPVTFGVNDVIAGWSEALPMMKEGDKWQLVIPPKLGYGDRGAGGHLLASTASWKEGRRMQSKFK